MPYNSIKDLGKGKENLPKGAKKIFMGAYNSANKTYSGDEERCSKIAWSAVKKKYKKNAEGDWVLKESLGESKSCLCPNDNKHDKCPKCGSNFDKDPEDKKIKCTKCGKLKTESNVDKIWGKVISESKCCKENPKGDIEHDVPDLDSCSGKCKKCKCKKNKKKEKCSESNVDKLLVIFESEEYEAANEREEGYNSYEKGKKKPVCPYTKKYQIKAWNTGWNEAKQDKEEEDK